MPLAIFLMEIEQHRCSQFVHKFTMAIKLAHEIERYLITLPLVVLYRLTLVDFGHHTIKEGPSNIEIHLNVGLSCTT